MKTVSSTEAKNRLGALIGEVEQSAEGIVVEHHGRPRVVIVPADLWVKVNEVYERARVQEAWERLQRISDEVRARNQDLTQEEADAIADEIGDEVKRRIADRLRSG
jgi:prevent-host-death family protein